MNKKRNLFYDLNIKGNDDTFQSPLDIDMTKIKDMVNNSISSADTERKKGYMKMNKKIISVAAAAVLVLGITVFAASSMISGWYTVSSSEDAFDVLPTAEECAENIGYEPVIIETFENGYTFSGGNILDNGLHDENGDVAEMYKTIVMRYEKNGDSVSFTQVEIRPEYVQTGDVIASTHGVDIYYTSYTSKCVPTDYVMTEEDRIAEESGEVIFSYGSDTVETRTVQNVSWNANGISGSLMQIDGKLSAEELSEMATEAVRAR